MSFLRQVQSLLRAWAPAASRDGRVLALRGLAYARSEFVLLLVLFSVAGGIWAFVNLAEAVNEGETESFDQAVLLALRNPADLSDPLGPLWFEEAARDVTALGGNFVLAFASFAVIGFFMLTRRRAAALFVAVSVGGGALLGLLLKFAFERPRPALVPHGAEVYTASFPSSHAMLSAATYLTLGVLLARLQVERRVKGYFLAVAVLLALLVGTSRVYLGVHWPTDVLAGWAMGAAWALGVWVVTLWLQQRGKVESPG